MTALPDPIPNPRCLVRGSGDIGSAIALALFRAGCPVLLHDDPAPAYSRRGAAFVDALFDGEARLEGVAARRLGNLEHIPHALARREAIPVAAQDFAAVLAAARPQALIDARMRKRSLPEPQRGLAPLTIGLGPNFVAGETTDLVIETAWGDGLGRVIEAGSSLPLCGEPKPVGGVGRERYVYAPCAGVFESGRAIGEAVRAGEAVAHIGDRLIAAPVTGVLRGLTRSGAAVAAGTKVVEVVPQEAAGLVFEIGARARRIAEAVLQAVRTRR